MIVAAAGVGYDMASGLGSPNAAALTGALCTDAIAVTNPGSQRSTLGASMSFQVKALDSHGLGLSYSATGLPTGLSISSSTGAITGTPTTAGTYSTTVTVTDSTGATGTAAFTWTVSSSGGGGSCTSTQLLGTAALTNPAFVKEAARAFPGRIVVGADAVGGKVATDGWATVSELTPAELGVDIAPRLVTLKVEEPAKRAGGVKVKDVAELVEKLRREAKVIA